MKHSRTEEGFTLVEIMIVVAIIGVLNALAIPAFKRARMDAVATRVANDFRIYADAFTMQAAESGNWLPRRARSRLPHQMKGYINPEAFEDLTVLGGRWKWAGPTRAQVKRGRTTARLRMQNLRRANRDILTRVDEILDDGNLKTGQVVGNRNRLDFILES